MKVKFFTHYEVEIVEREIQEFLAVTPVNFLKIELLERASGVIIAALTYREKNASNVSSNVGPSGCSITPKCSACGSKMSLRHRRNDGAPFWGCTSWPNCNNTSSYREYDDVNVTPHEGGEDSYNEPEDDDIPF